MKALSSLVSPIGLGRRKSQSVPSTGSAPTGMPRSSEMSTVDPGARRITESTVSAPTVRYGWAPLPNGHGAGPRLVAVVRTRRPSSESRYSMASSSENG